MSCIQFLVCGILTAIPAIVLEHPQLSAFHGALGAILYAGIMSCGVAYTLQIIGQKNMNPTVASLILSLESCISVLAGWIILGQNLTKPPRDHRLRNNVRSHHPRTITAKRSSLTSYVN